MVGEVVGITYGDDGNYTVTATVYDFCGNSATSSGTVTVNNVAPVAEPDEIEVSESDMATIIDVLGNDTDEGCTTP
jgi:hypothetical protein